MRLLTVFILLTISTTVYADFVPRFATANIREEASINSTIIETVQRGAVLKDLKNVRQGLNSRFWHYIETPTGLKGYVASDVINDFELRDVALPIKKSTTNTVKNSNTTVVSDNTLHRVNISLKNLNRLSCGSKISDPIYSKDKEFEVVRGGDKDLFLKISPIKTTTADGVTEIKFNTFERELFVECLGKIYNFTFIPVDNLPTQTIIIEATFQEIEKARNTERISDYEELIYSLVKHAYLEQIPTGYKMSKGNLAYQFKELEIKLRYVYKGYDYVVEDWEIKSVSPQVIDLDESSFIPYIKSARAVTFVAPRLSKNEKTRMLVVRLNSN